MFPAQFVSWSSFHETDVYHRPRKNPLNSGADPNHGADTQTIFQVGPFLLKRDNKAANQRNKTYFLIVSQRLKHK